MTSIFTLKTSVSSDIADANEGASRMMYEQHPPTRDVTNGNFPNGAIHFRWQTSGQKWWVPSRTYLRLRAKLTKAIVPPAVAGLPLDLSDNIAPNMGLCANLFQNGEFRIADKTVSRVSDYMAQIDALETRLCKSKSYLDSVGAATNFWQDEFKSRQLDVASDANNEVSQDVKVGRANLPTIDPLNTIEVSAAGVFTIAQNGAGSPPNLANVFVPGDLVEIEAGGDVGTVVYRVSNVIDGTTMQLNNQAYVALAAAVLPFSRIRKAVIKDNDARKVSEFEMVWQPPLSVFKLPHAMPAGKYELVLNPQTSSQWKKRAIESLGIDKSEANFDFDIADMYLYTATIEGPRADDVTYLLDLEETRCQVDNIDTGGNFQQKNFDVSPSTYALTTCFQDTRAGTLTQYSASKFKIEGDRELGLNRLFVNYAGQNRPAPDADPQYSVGDARDYTVQRYAETQIYSGAYYDTGGAETLKEWQERGSTYYFSWPRDGTDRSTRVNVHFGFDGAVPNGRVLLFDHSKKIGRIRVQDGRVIDVQVEDA